MKLPWLRRRFGALLTPEGLYALRLPGDGNGPEILHDGPARVVASDAGEAAAYLAEVVRAHGGGHGRLALAVQGFGSCYHMLEFPPAEDEVLRPVILRELRRIHPDLDDPAVGFEAVATSVRDGQPKRELRVGALPTRAVESIQHELRARGITLDHLTVPPEAVQRVYATYIRHPEPTAVLFFLPGAPLLGFFLDGALRLFREPPADPFAGPDRLVPMIAGEVERGALFLRQQFRGANVERLLVAAPPDEQAALEAGLQRELALPIERLDAGGISPGMLVALGAALDADAEAAAVNLLPPALRPPTRVEQTTRSLVTGGAAVVALAAVWWAWGGITVAQESGRRVAALETSLEERVAPLARIEPAVTARRAHAERVAFVAGLEEERGRLQQVLHGAASVVPDEIRLDSLRLQRSDDTWEIRLGGVSTGVSSARAARGIDRYYRALSHRLAPREITLVRFEPPPGDPAAPAGPSGPVAIAFEMSLIVPTTEESDAP